jgi:hypothetical protein
MLAPGEVAEVVRLHEPGWGTKRIAPEGLEGWLSERFQRHRGNCDMVCQDLAREHSIELSPRTASSEPLRHAERRGGKPAATHLLAAARSMDLHLTGSCGSLLTRLGFDLHNEMRPRGAIGDKAPVALMNRSWPGLIEKSWKNDVSKVSNAKVLTRLRYRPTRCIVPAGTRIAWQN